MNLNKHITALLYRYQCVTVPGFGAFITENQPAQLNGSAVSFVAPRKVISFNANIKNNDGLLTNHVALSEKVAYEIALEQINIEVRNWLVLLERREILIFENIGNIKLSTDSIFYFEPVQTTNYLTSSFGLSNFIAPIIKREELKKQVEELEEVVPLIFTPEKKKNYSYLKYAAALLLFGLVGTFGYKIHYDNKIDQKTLLVNQKVQEKVQTAVQEATFFIENPLPEVTFAVQENEVDSRLKYHIVGGVFSSSKNATRAYNSFLKQGYKAELGDLNSKGMHPVYYQSFSTLFEAEHFLQTLRKKSNNEAWLLID